MKRYFPIIIFFLSLQVVYAQDRMIEGTVSDESTEPLIGVSVYLKGTPSQVCFTDIDGKYRINIPSDLKYPVLVFSFIAFESQEIDASYRDIINVTLVEISDHLDEEIVYVESAGIILQGGLPDTNFGVGGYFNNMLIIDRYLGINTNQRFFGKALYFTDFSDNYKVNVEINGMQYQKFYLKTAFNRYKIPSESMDLNIYRLGGSYTLKERIRDFPIAVSIDLEYLDQRYAYMDDHISFIVGVYSRHTNIPFSADMGVSHRGKIQFLAKTSLPSNWCIPFGTFFEAGYWMNRFRCKTEMSRSFRRWSIAVGYERIYKYQNCYLTLSIPLQKIETGFWYRNLLK